MLGLLLVLSACTRPNPEHCGGNDDCSNGFVCDLPSNRCVMAPEGGFDAGSDAALDASPDAPLGPRCDPTAAFGTPTLVPTVNSALGVFSLSLTANELTGFFTSSDNGSDYLLKAATRATREASFPAPTASSALVTLAAVQGIESFPSSAGDGLALYFHRSNPQTFTTAIVVSTRATPTATFTAGSQVTVDGISLVDASRPLLAATGMTLYWADDVDLKLRSAAAGPSSDAFFVRRVESTMSLGGGGFAISADELTLYYGKTDIFVSTRSSKLTPFGVGVAVPVLNSPQLDEALTLTNDECLLFVASQRAGGVGSYNIWVARRP